jgi:hypothetical protein
VKRRIPMIPLLEKTLIQKIIKVSKKNQNRGRYKWIQKTIPYPQEVTKNLDTIRFERFVELLKNICLQMPLFHAIKMPTYYKYMKDIVTNKTKIPIEAITTMLAD